MDIVDIKNVFGYEKDFKDIEIKKDKIRNYEHKKSNLNHLSHLNMKKIILSMDISFIQKDYNKKIS